MSKMATCTRTNWKSATSALVFLSAVLLRIVTGLGSYSGMNTPPMFGDYEAQRHWMEVTLHLPVQEWYKNTTRNDLGYWGLDYPPLTAYISLFFGHIADGINSTWVAERSSRGIQSDESKLFMRMTVILSDILFYFPAIYSLAGALYPQSWTRKTAWIAACLLFPSLILIDHGHFQYNCVMLGFTAWAVHFAVQDFPMLSAFAFCSALFFKQMSLYYAPAIFAYYLGRCFREKRGYVLFLQLAVAVVGTFVIYLLPFGSSLEDIMQVIRRLFPFNRGLFEDKVANFWCAISIVVKLKSWLDASALVKLSAVITLAVLLPSCIHVGMHPSRRNLLFALANSSLAFFLFSYQVHEKSILLPALPALFLLHESPSLAIWMINISMFSMFPLLKKDGLTLQYVGMGALWNFFASVFTRSCGAGAVDLEQIVIWVSYAGMLVIHLIDATLSPPPRYESLFVMFNVVLSSGCLMLILLRWTVVQLQGNDGDDGEHTSKQKSE